MDSEYWRSVFWSGIDCYQLTDSVIPVCSGPDALRICFLTHQLY